jgi:hypothetical protein
MKKEKIKKAWDWFKGKKRNIGIVALFVLRGITLFAPDAIPIETTEYIRLGIDIGLLGGAYDAVRRTKAIRK